MTDCKNALAEGGLDLNKAIDVLRKKGANVAAKSAGRAASRGLVGVASATDHKAACMVELNCETVRSQFNFVSFCQMFINYMPCLPFQDFVGMNDRFQLGVEQIAQAALPLLGETKDINGASQVRISFGFLPASLPCFNSSRDVVGCCFR